MAVPSPYGHDPHRPVAMEARAANDAPAPADALFVNIPREPFGPRGPVRGVRPEGGVHEGDVCLVVFSEVGEPWVVAWA